MKRYRVTRYFHTSVDLYVYADSEEEAIEKAENMEIDPDEVMSGLTKDDDTDACEDEETVTEKIKRLWNEFVNEHGHSPKFAIVVIKYDGEDEEATDLIKVSGFERGNTENDPDDDDVVFYADGLRELIGINEKGWADFRITDIHEFSDTY